MDVTMHESPSLATITQCSRRSHRKTRTGCMICKARKIKCDETKPHCNNCLKRSVQCEYPTLPPTSSDKILLSASDEQVANSPESAYGDSQLSLDLVNMELLHHYTTSTYHTLRRDPVQRTLWQMTVCEIGFSNEFVLRGILAIAALHLASLRPSRKDFYISRGIMHHELGLRRATSLLPYMDKENCTPLCIFAALAGIFAMARPRTQEDFLLVNDKGLANWMVLMRGMSSIIGSATPTLFSGPLGPMFQNGHRRFLLRSPEPPMDSSVHGEEVKLLQQRILSSCVDPRLIEAYIGALTELHMSLNVLYTYAETYEASDAFIWVFRTPEAYFVLLKNQDPGALCIFAFFCVLLHQLGAHWWAKGWSTHLMDQIYRLLDDEHRYWVQWPIKQIEGMRIPEALCAEEWSHVVVWGTGQRFRVARADKNKEKLQDYEPCTENAGYPYSPTYPAQYYSTAIDREAVGA
ncbi:hypothetical protein V499_04014 [Pseudogymnoascus sp. VKM F-103]|nr:hypothetical protein V499_04014 [Pseudogymnoascus sp. VKM F-103]